MENKTLIESMCDGDKMVFSVIESTRKHVNQNFKTGRVTVRYADVYYALYEYKDGTTAKKLITKRLYNALIAINDKHQADSK